MINTIKNLIEEKNSEEPTKFIRKRKTHQADFIKPPQKTYRFSIEIEFLLYMKEQN